MSATLRLLEELIARRSVTPADDGCQAVIAARLEHAGFDAESMAFRPSEARVHNLWVRHRGRDDVPVVV